MINIQLRDEAELIAILEALGGALYYEDVVEAIPRRDLYDLRERLESGALICPICETVFQIHFWKSTCPECSSKERQ